MNGLERGRDLQEASYTSHVAYWDDQHAETVSVGANDIHVARFLSDAGGIARGRMEWSLDRSIRAGENSAPRVQHLDYLSQARDSGERGLPQPAWRDVFRPELSIRTNRDASADRAGSTLELAVDLPQQAIQEREVQQQGKEDEGGRQQ
jgi:hypothetical protein